MGNTCWNAARDEGAADVGRLKEIAEEMAGGTVVEEVDPASYEE
jgi:hypothetical protein